MRIFLGALLAAAVAPSLAHAQAPSPPPIVVTVLPASVAAEPAPVPPIESTGTNWTLLAPGIGLFAGGWLLGWLTTIVWNVASAQCHTVPGTSGFISTPTLECDPPRGPYGAGDWQMAIPIVGPFLTFLGDETFRGVDIWFPITMAALQVTGLALSIAGLASPHHVTRPGEPQIQVGLGSFGISTTF